MIDPLILTNNIHLTMIILNIGAILFGLTLIAAYNPMMYGCEPPHFSKAFLLGFVVTALSIINLAYIW